MKKHTLIALVLTVSLGLLTGCSPEDTKSALAEEKQRALVALASAEEAGASEWAPSQLRVAKAKLAQAESLAQQEKYGEAKKSINEYYVLVNAAKSDAQRAQSKASSMAETAATTVGTTAAQEKQNLEGNVSALNNEIRSKDRQIAALNRRIQKQDTQYIVKKGDTLSSIAQKLYGDKSQWKKLVSLNSEIVPNANWIYPGMALVTE